MLHGKWVCVYMAWRVLTLRMEEQPPVWRVAVNIMNNPSQTSESGGPPAWGLSELITTPHCKNMSWYEFFTEQLRIGTDGGYF